MARWLFFSLAGEVEDERETILFFGDPTVLILV